MIVGGAEIRQYSVIRGYLRPDDFLICCDSGLRHRERLGIEPNLIVGDFDSHENPHLATETIVLPHEKDDTDTMFAVKEGISRGFEEFLLVGVAGGRLDHTLANLSALLYLDARGKTAMAVDDYSEMEVVSRRPALISDRYPYFSLLNISGVARGITIQNAKFPLKDSEITCEDPLGVSNEVLPGRTAQVTVKTGRLLLIRDRTE